MTDIWDDLCEEFDKSLSMQEYLIPHSLKDKWNKVKAEGDRLKAKAEKFDKLVKIKPSKLLLEQMNEKRACEQKLEAAQNWFNDWINPWMLLLNKDEDGFQLSKKRMISLKEILEGATLQNIGESQT